MRKTRKMGLHSPIFCDRIPTALDVHYERGPVFISFCGQLINFVYFNLRNKTQSLQLPGVLYASGNEVDAGGLNAGVAQYIRQFGYIPAGPVEGPGEQVPQVVGEYFRGGHAGLFA